MSAATFIDTTSERVTVKTERGNLYIGPNGRIDGLWRIVERELRTNAQVRKLCACSRPTLIRWRSKASDPFPEPIITLREPKGKIELWERSAVEAWHGRYLASRDTRQP